MRKIYQQLKKHNERHAALSWLRKIRTRRNRKLRRTPAGIRSAVVLRQGKSHKTRTLKPIPLPKTLCLDENIAETLQTISNIHESILDQAVNLADNYHRGRKTKTERSYFDFTTLERIGPSAALILAAIYQRGKSITGKKIWTVDEHKWNPEVIHILRMLGFHELLEMRPLKPGYKYTGPIHIQKFVSGSRADGEAAGLLQEALGKLLPEAIRDNFLTAEPYGGMLEAILNSHMWAYPDDHEWRHPCLTNWWLTGVVDTDTNEVVVSVYDQGVSIPSTLPNWKHWGRLELYAKKLAAKMGLTADINDPRYDGLSIRLAMTIAKTKTDLPQHGKGLHTMIEVAERARVGRLRILSRNGEFVWETGKRPKHNNHEYALNGTLVEWQLQL